MELSLAREKEIRSLFTRKGRRKSGKLVIEGVRAIRTAFDYNLDPDYVVVSYDQLTMEGKAFFQRLRRASIPILEANSKTIAKLSDTVQTQGFLAVVKTPLVPDRVKLLKDIRLTLYVDGLNDPGNLGTIIRTAAAFNVDYIALSGNSVDFSSPKVIRASAGLCFALPIEKISRPETFFESLQSNNIAIYGTDVRTGSLLEDLKFEDKVCLIIGSEPHGISKISRQYCNKFITIKTMQGVESLNVASATAIALNKIAGELQLL